MNDEYLPEKRSKKTEMMETEKKTIKKRTPKKRTYKKKTTKGSQKKKTTTKKTSEVKPKKETLEECTIRTLELLQLRGQMVFKDIFTELGIGYRRAYDILNVLLTTPLLTKKGKKRESNMPYVYLDGEPLPENVDVRNVLEQIESEEQQIKVLTKYIQRLEEELENDELSDLQQLLEEFNQDEYDLRPFVPKDEMK
ncbi:transcription factor e2f [Anaeramoeba flamelloides]|uniref:Transcription factor e2f n=1 Tax=Anaeramoeba flamelloides TaxID=1746091 RepID=A0AAV7Y0R7_9EUKA|nr:transcription factor e2f [Anaeramoeba flamelloides]KAJ6234516.1 transcription factor e2f [Anaeramoeba flamelloides]